VLYLFGGGGIPLKRPVVQQLDSFFYIRFNPLNTDLNPICHLLALLGAHHILHVSGLRVNIDVRDILRLEVSPALPPQYPGCSSSYLHLSLIQKIHGWHNFETFFSKPLTKDTKFQLCIFHLPLFEIKKKRLEN